MMIGHLTLTQLWEDSDHHHGVKALTPLVGYGLRRRFGPLPELVHPSAGLANDILTTLRVGVLGCLE